MITTAAQRLHRRKGLSRHWLAQGLQLFPLCLSLCLPLCLRASTVTGNLITSTGNPYVTNILFTPLSTPLVAGSLTIASRPTNVITASDGSFSVPLKNGNYLVNLGQFRKDSFFIAVPNDNNSYSLNSLITNNLSYTYGGSAIGLYGDGDVNGDGILSTLDTAAIDKWLLTGTNLTTSQQQRADLDGDGIITWLDREVINALILGTYANTSQANAQGKWIHGKSMTVDINGNFVIGTNRDANAKLEVVGAGLIQGALYLGGQDWGLAGDLFFWDLSSATYYDPFYMFDGDVHISSISPHGNGDVIIGSGAGNLVAVQTGLRFQVAIPTTFQSTLTGDGSGLTNLSSALNPNLASSATSAALTNLIKAAQSGTMQLSNLLAMGITNIIAGTNAVIYTNNGTLVINGAASGGSAGAATATNCIFNLSIGSAMLAATNMPYYGGGYQDLELSFPRTNNAGTDIALSATWQFIVPADYATNTGSLRLTSLLTATNGPNASNVVWRASFIHAENGSTTDLHVGSYGTAYLVTNAWSACFNCTNQIAVNTIAFTNQSGLSANGFGVLKIERVSTSDGYVGAVSLIGATLEYGKQ